MSSKNVSNRGFYKHTILAMIGITGSKLRENKNIHGSINMLSQSVLNTGPQPFGSNAFLSELLRQVLFLFFFVPAPFNLGLGSFS